MESTSMGGWLRIFPKWLVSLCATLLVGSALWLAQCRGRHVGTNAVVYARHTSVTDNTVHGWPESWVLRHENWDTSLPSSRKSDYSLVLWNLAVDLAAWIAVVIATARESWRMHSCRGQFTLRFLFSITSVVAILLAWWRIEYVGCFVDGVPVLWDPQTPMLRILQFPPLVCIPVLLGVGCAILCMIDATFYVLNRLSRFKERSQ